MGMGDLSQPCLRGDFSTADWVQHKFRYFDDRFVSSARGHRVTWAMFNTAMLDASKRSGQAYYRASDCHALTKTELKDLVESRDDLVRSMATFGADIPTTPMFWKRQTNQLEWIVRQMSWVPPWIASDTAEEISAGSNEAVGDKRARSEHANNTEEEPSMARVWSQLPKQQLCRDIHGYGRIPAFWATLN